MSEVNELLRGTIKAWDDAKGYGFIEPHEKGKDVFFHIKQWSLRDERPNVGRQVFFIVEAASRGKLRASLVRPLAAAPVEEETVSFRSLLKGDLGIFVLCAAGVLIVLFGLIVKLPLEVAAAYIVSSILTYLLYRSDKLSAAKRQSRVPEVTLHFFGLLCGWPGGLVAQQRLRHKTIKTSFQVVFWLTALINLFLVALYVFHRQNPEFWIS